MTGVFDVKWSQRNKDAVGSTVDVRRNP